MAAAYSSRTISNYLNSVCAWHILHSIPWTLNKMEMDTMLWAVDKLTPRSLRRKKRCLYTPKFIAAIRQHLNLEKPLDAAVFACLATCFYASTRLGKFTVPTLSSFHPNAHITTQNLSYDQDRGGLGVTILHLPFTKAAGNKGKDVYWAMQTGAMDPMAALKKHLLVNEPPETAHLFAYQAKNMRCLLTKAKFLERVKQATHAARLKHLQGHSLCIGSTLAPHWFHPRSTLVPPSLHIGSTLEYLLRGVLFDIVKTKGCWARDSFQLYLRKHAVILAPYIQAVPTLHEMFICYAMPPVQ
ncbi:hypothetical protein EDB86DRAFT_3079702 [Lactarius hatsudake]|nr:hypothetical protein EDB86DRAFT_3079702 [Lactarius hatsudake]